MMLQGVAKRKNDEQRNGEGGWDDWRESMADRTTLNARERVSYPRTIWLEVVACTVGIPH